MKYDFRAAKENESVYLFSQSMQLMGQTGNIGRLRGDFNFSNEFYTTWFDGFYGLKTEEFKSELNEAVNALRTDKFGEVLKDLDSMRKYCRAHSKAKITEWDRDGYGFRLDSEKYTFMLLCIPKKGDYNFYVYAYERYRLDGHIQQAEKGIRFINSRYNELFRIPDGGKILMEYSDGEKSVRICRYIDDYHTEIGSQLYHICQFAELCENNGVKYSPVKDKEKCREAER